MDEDQLKDFLKGLADKFAIAQSAFTIYKAIHSKSKTNVEVLDHAASFFKIVQTSLSTEIIVSLDALFNERAKRSLHGFLSNAADSAYGKVRIVDCAEIKLTRRDIIEAQTAGLKSQAILNDIKLLRDKVKAHHDPQYFSGPKKQQELPFLPFDEIDLLINVAQEIISYHWAHLFGPELNNIVYSVESDTTAVFNSLERHSRWCKDPDVFLLLDKKGLL